MWLNDGLPITSARLCGAQDDPAKGAALSVGNRLDGSQNRLISLWSPQSINRMGPYSRRVRLGRGSVLSEPDMSPHDVFFVEEGVASVVRPEKAAGRIEICLVGREGFTGSPIVLADGRWPYQTFVQTDGLMAIAVDAIALKESIDQDEGLRSLLLRASHVQMIQIAEGLASAAWQPLTSRLARWLLMYRDRLGVDRLEVTHEFIAYMVGAQRSGITDALHQLEGRGLLTASRGLIILRDVSSLEGVAGWSYGNSEAELARLLSASEVR